MRARAAFSSRSHSSQAVCKSQLTFITHSLSVFDCRKKNAQKSTRPAPFLGRRCRDRRHRLCTIQTATTSSTSTSLSRPRSDSSSSSSGGKRRTRQLSEAPLSLRGGESSRTREREREKSQRRGLLEPEPEKPERRCRGRQQRRRRRRRRRLGSSTSTAQQASSPLTPRPPPSLRSARLARPWALCLRSAPRRQQQQ